jgi:uncharacterized protein (DUF58 family)
MSFQLLTVGTAAAGLALVGIVYNSDAAYFMCSALLAVLLVSFISSRLSTRALTWRREIADRVFENDPFTVTLHVTNQGRLPLFLVKFGDTVPEYVHPLEAPNFVLPALWPGESVTLTYRARAVKRGVYRLGPLHVSISDPFGVFQRVAGIALPGEAVIFPRPLSLLTDLDEGGTDIRGTISGELALASDSGMDFYGIRDYQPGDELRRIHWPATAHHGKITVIEFERGTSGSVVAVLDTKQGTEYGEGTETTLEVGVRIAASLAHWALTNDGTACLAMDTATEARWEQADYPDQERRILEALAWARADGRLPVSAVAEWAAARLPTGAAVAILTAAPDANLPVVVQWLTDRNAHVAVLTPEAGAFGATAGLSPEMEQALRIAGAQVTGYRRGRGLQEFLNHVLLSRV